MVRVSALSADCNNPIPEGHTYDVVILTSNCVESDIANWIALKNNLRKSTGQVPGTHLVLASAMAFFGVAFLDLGFHEFMAEEVLPKKRPAPSTTGPKKSQAASGTESTFVKKVARYSDLQDCLDITWSSTSTCPSLSPKSIPKGFLLLEVLRRCTIADLPLNIEFLKSVWTSVSATLGVDSGFLSDEEFACCCGAPSPSVNAVLGGVVAQEVVRAITGKGAPYGNWYFFNGLQCSMTVEWLPKEDICLASATNSV
ncbi:ubiquitin-like 1-activating enzyme E1 A [Clonorchis sinensis]|uniref:Ubiquitin-like 1-activating enzyme E1 A n=1 Tax=Clonorchis sinensis TaxID=79923 RepID=G7YAS9_CLOSI|nr:ubiquitin-like 1-activating enzyme E1 A [Clonorchis sinensis]